MASILFLCHRLPWPPDKGDKIRSYHVLRRLAEHHRVYLGAFVDDPADRAWLPQVQAVCAGTCIRPLKRGQARRRALGALARGEALTLGCYRDPVMQRWVDGLVAEGKVDLALGYSSGVAPLLMRHERLPRVMDFVDVDSDKWRQYARVRRGPARLIYRREARRLARFEHEVATRFDASLFVSRAEAALFCRDEPELVGKVHGIGNGVDAAYWDPYRDYPDPYAPGQRVVVFAGAMDYRANVHAAQWFAERVWPRIAARRPGARFCIVGARPAREVRALDGKAGVTVTGRVDDVRPYLAHAHAVATPLRIARGIQNKVLEALVMEKPVLATPQAWEGIEGDAGSAACISDSPADMAAEALRWLEPARPVRIPVARAMVLSRYDWTRNLDAYESVLRNVRPDPVTVPVMDAAAGEAYS